MKKNNWFGKQLKDFLKEDAKDYDEMYEAWYDFWRMPGIHYEPFARSEMVVDMEHWAAQGATPEQLGYLSVWIGGEGR